MSIIYVGDSLRNSAVTMVNLICMWNFNLELICFLIYFFLITSGFNFKGLTKAKKYKSGLQYVKYWQHKCLPTVGDCTWTGMWNGLVAAGHALHSHSVQDREDNSKKKKERKRKKSDKLLWKPPQIPHSEQMRPIPLSKMHHSCQKFTAKKQKFQSCLSTLRPQL